MSTLIRAGTNGTRSLDDFARAFFGTCRGKAETIPYDREDVTRALGDIYAHDWQAFFAARLDECHDAPPFDGIRRSGYELVFLDRPNAFQRAADDCSGVLDFTHSLGVSLGTKGLVNEVIWAGPAFDAGLTAGAKIVAVNGWGFSETAMETAVDASRGSGVTRLIVEKLKHCEQIDVVYSGGPRYPHLIRTDAPDILRDILKGRIVQS